MKIVTWKTSPRSDKTRSAPLLRQSYGKKDGSYVIWAGRSTFIPKRLIVDVSESA